MSFISRKGGLALVGFAILILALAALYLPTKRGEGPGPGGPKGSLDGEDSPPPSDPKIYADRLLTAGWNSEAAQAVADLNAEWFSIQGQENPNGLEYQFKLLAGLGKHPELFDFLVRRPETAGMLAASSNPNLIAQSLENPVTEEDYARITGLYVRYASPQDAAELSIALKNNYDLISELSFRGFLGSEVLFIFDRDSTADDEYENWLREVIRTKLDASNDDEIASFVNFVLVKGSSIRRRMLDDEVFQREFRVLIWPRFERVLATEKEQAYEHYFYENHLWDLLALEDGEELLRRSGLLALDLLFGYPEIDHRPYPKELHREVIQILLKQEQLAIDCLWKFRHERQFHALLKRRLTRETRDKAFYSLLQSGENYPAKLSDFESKRDEALDVLLSPPPSGLITWVPLYYTLYEVPRKRLLGIEPSGMDLFNAAVDPVFLIIDLATIGTGGKVGKALVKAPQKMFVTTLRDQGLEYATKRVGSAVAKKKSEKELASWAVSSTLSEVKQMVHSTMNTINRATTFEITNPIRFMFDYSGVGRESFKRLTTLEARLFMRGDAKVFVRLGNIPHVILGPLGTKLFARTAEDLSIGMVVESEAGQDALNRVTITAMSASEELRAWQQNISAWWLMNATPINTFPMNASPIESSGKYGQ